MAWWRGRRGREAGAHDVDAAIRRALHAVLDHDLDAAEASLADAVRGDVERDRRAISRSPASIDSAARSAARSTCTRTCYCVATSMPTRDSSALVGLADDFREGGFLRRAIAAYEEVLAHQPRHVRALQALVRLFVGVREPRRAIPLARRLARIEGVGASLAEATLWVDLAESERAEGRTQVARKALRRALRADPENLRAWTALGLVEGELGNPKRALAAWRRVPEIDRRAGPNVYPRLAATFAALGRARDYEVPAAGTARG